MTHTVTANHLQTGQAIPATASTAAGQRCLYCGAEYPLYPPVIGGCPACASVDFRSPLELIYHYPADPGWLPEVALPGLARYAPMLPPLVEWVSMGEGGTPLVPFPADPAHRTREVYIKDESRNPTWSHKDRLNLAVVSTALLVGARGVVAASSGNHGAAAAAYSRRAGLPAVILSTPRPPAVASFLQGYGQFVIAVPDVETRWKLMSRLVDEMGYHPASNQTIPPTNHPFGSENYKTIAYELYLQLGCRAPEAVFVPVGFAELIFGIYKGFAELMRYGLINTLPRMMACEPAAGAPLKQALETGQPVARVEVGESEAQSIAVSVNSYRGVVAVRESGGAALAVSEQEMAAAQDRLRQAGLWVEMSSAVSVAGLDYADVLGLGAGPLVCINTSSGFKDSSVGQNPIPTIDGSWDALLEAMKKHGLA
jgi:threonine synthase